MRLARLFNDDNAYWLSRYLCEAHLEKGQPDAERALRAIHAKHARTKERVAETRERLAELRTPAPRPRRPHRRPARLVPPRRGRAAPPAPAIS